ncbi:MAG TPA: MFS transporter [Pseudolysinimonas sp.]|nr:MFS transporter [Pseudolysinimonas sp.]
MSLTAPAPGIEGLGKRRWAALTILLLALAMSLFDVTIVNLTLPSVTKSFGEHPIILSWLVAGYLLGYALSLVPAGRAGDRFGHKWIFIIGVAGYVLTAIMVSVSADANILIVGRVLHGIAGGLMVAPITAFIHLMFPGVSKVRAFGYFAATTGLAALVGPIIGGVVLDAIGVQDGWRWALIVGLPLGVIAFILAFALLPNIRGSVSGSFDVLGMLLLSIVVVGFIAPLMQQLPDWTWISLGIAVVVLIIFILWERAVDHRGATPVLRLSHFRKLPFSLGLLQVVLGFASFTSPIYIAIITVWQWGRGEDALQTALVMLTFGLGAIIGGVIDARFTLWFRRWDATAALILLVLGYVVTYLLLVADGAHVSLLVLAIPLLFAGIGNGAFIGMIMSTILSAVPARDAGSAGGLVVTAMRLGSAFGAAVILILTALPAAKGASESQHWIDNGNWGVLGCIVFAAVALLLAIIVGVRTPKDTSASAGEDALVPDEVITK